jgi:hypothetical protein
MQENKKHWKTNALGISFSITTACVTGLVVSTLLHRRNINCYKNALRKHIITSQPKEATLIDIRGADVSTSYKKLKEGKYEPTLSKLSVMISNTGEENYVDTVWDYSDAKLVHRLYMRDELNLKLNIFKEYDNIFVKSTKDKVYTYPTQYGVAASNNIEDVINYTANINCNKENDTPQECFVVLSTLAITIDICIAMM